MNKTLDFKSLSLLSLPSSNFYEKNTPRSIPTVLENVSHRFEENVSQSFTISFAQGLNNKSSLQKFEPVQTNHVQPDWLKGEISELLPLTGELGEELFKILKDFKENKEKDHKIKSGCQHYDIIKKNGITICSDCGEEINQELSMEAEWRYYGDSDSRYESDPSRCSFRKITEKSIYKYVQGLGLEEHIIDISNAKFLEIAKDKILRKKSLIGTIFACVWNVYKLTGDPQVPDDLLKKFKIDRKTGMAGLKFYCLNRPKNEKIIYINPIHYIHKILKDVNAPNSHILEMKQLYKSVENRSTLVKHSNPRSISIAVVFFYYKVVNKSPEILESIFKLSDTTLNKIFKDINRCLGVS